MCPKIYDRGILWIRPVPEFAMHVFTWLLFYNFGNFVFFIYFWADYFCIFYCFLRFSSSNRRKLSWAFTLLFYSKRKCFAARPKLLVCRLDQNVTLYTSVRYEGKWATATDLRTRPAFILPMRGSRHTFHDSALSGTKSWCNRYVCVRSYMELEVRTRSSNSVMDEVLVVFVNVSNSMEQFDIELGVGLVGIKLCFIKGSLRLLSSVFCDWNMCYRF